MTATKLLRIAIALNRRTITGDLAPFASFRANR